MFDSETLGVADEIHEISRPRDCLNSHGFVKTSRNTVSCEFQAPGGVKDILKLSSLSMNFALERSSRRRELGQSEASAHRTDAKSYSSE